MRLVNSVNIAVSCPFFVPDPPDTGGALVSVLSESLTAIEGSALPT